MAFETIFSDEFAWSNRAKNCKTNVIFHRKNKTESHQKTLFAQKVIISATFFIVFYRTFCVVKLSHALRRILQPFLRLWEVAATKSHTLPDNPAASAIQDVASNGYACNTKPESAMLHDRPRWRQPWKRHASRSNALAPTLQHHPALARKCISICSICECKYIQNLQIQNANPSIGFIPQNCELPVLSFTR